jgi:hypothetical protein
MPTHHHIDYVEFAADDPALVKTFYARVFGWLFEDYGPDYVAFSGSGIAGGFYRAPLKSEAAHGGALVVVYSSALEASQAAVVAAGGHILKAIFSFPGGRRFEFADPCGNHLAVWSE